jgi:hypothetical protein
VLPPIELLLPPGGPRVVEALGADGRTRGFAIAGDDVHDLSDPGGFERFLRGPGAALDPLTLILLAARYRLPAIAGGEPLRLVTSAAELHPSVPAGAIPVDLVRDGAGFAFTTEFRATGDGVLRVGVDRWHMATGPAAALGGRALHRGEAPA